MEAPQRVVITGMGVCSPNAVGLENFHQALRHGKSGVRHQPELEALNFRCTVGAAPVLNEAILEHYLTPLERKRITAKGIIYGLIAGLEAWHNAGLSIPENEEALPHWNWGCVFGTGLSGVNTLREAIYKTDEKKVKKLGSTVVEQTMPSGISALLGGKLGLGNWVSSNASACSTGTESIIMAAEQIRSGRAELMLAGSCDADGPYVWGGFDSMRVLTYSHNETPEKASRPMAEDAAGFVPGSGAGALVLESLASAERRGATIYAEIPGGYINSGGQRQNGSMTAPNDIGVRRCIEAALYHARINANEIDLICGHLTSTMGDVREIINWSEALDLKRDKFPAINALKSLTGHCLSGAGSIEAVAAVLQLYHNFMHPSLNSENLHPDITAQIDEQRVVREFRETEINTVAKASFGFGDVNSCLLFKKFQS